VHCPKRKYTDLQKISLAYEEGLFQTDKRVQVRSVLVRERWPGSSCRASTTKGTRRTTPTAQLVGLGLGPLVVLGNIRRSIPRRDGRF
jgi:hypothetical protein